MMAQQLKNKGVNISSRTIRRFATQQGWKPYKITKKIFLSQKNITSRLTFAKRYQHLGKKEWRKWLFTDEKSFVLFRPPNTQNDRIYCHSPEEVLPKEVPKKSQSLMVWGGLTATGLTQLEFVAKGKKVNADTYIHEILEPALSKLKARRSTRTGGWFTQKLFRDGDDFTFQQDGAPAHRAKKTQAWLQENVPHFVKNTEWPGNSPDLNPIENLWAHMAEEVAKRDPKTLVELRESIEEEWEKIDVDFLEKLVFSMPTRMGAVLEANGRLTKY
jgi:hypothetical protein